MYSGKVLAYMH